MPHVLSSGHQATETVEPPGGRPSLPGPVRARTGRQHRGASLLSELAVNAVGAVLGPTAGGQFTGYFFGVRLPRSMPVGKLLKEKPRDPVAQRRARSVSGQGQRCGRHLFRWGANAALRQHSRSVRPGDPRAVRTINRGPRHHEKTTLQWQGRAVCRQVPQATPGAGKTTQHVHELRSRALLFHQTLLAFRH